MKMLNYLIAFCVFSFVIDLVLYEFSFEFLQDVPVPLTFDPKRSAFFTIDYFIIIIACIPIFAFIALLSLNIFGSGLGDSAVTLLKDVAFMVILIALLSPFPNVLFANCGSFGNVLMIGFPILFAVFYLVNMGGVANE